MTDNSSGDNAPRFVRQFVATQGRARSRGKDLSFETLIQTNAKGIKAQDHEYGERLAVLEVAATPMSIAEVSARIHVHLGIARVIVSDLAVEGLVSVSEPNNNQERPDIVTLERLLNDLQSY
jgi:hypothetical protein